MGDDVPERIGGYRILGRLGHGGMSVVYLAEHVHLKRRVALKVIASELAADDTFRVRIVRESQIAAALEHPHIVPIYDAGEADHVLYIAMRYIDGPDLGATLKQQPVPAERLVRDRHAGRRCRTQPTTPGWFILTRGGSAAAKAIVGRLRDQILPPCPPTSGPPTSETESVAVPPVLVPTPEPDVTCRAVS